jgi:hypothetical protein
MSNNTFTKTEILSYLHIYIISRYRTFPKLTKFITIILLLLLIPSFQLNAQSNINSSSQINFSGNASDFTGAGYTGYTDAGTGSVTYYIGFDNTYLYVGAFRNTSMGSSDNLAVYIDTDPNATPTGGTGTTSGQNYNSVTGSLPFSANYDAHVEQSYQEARPFGSTWSSTLTLSTDYSVYTTGTSREIKFKLSSIGNPAALYVTCWMGYSGGIYANAPGTNVGGGNPTITNYWGGFGLSSSGCNPIVSISTPITASCINAAPASGATYGYVSEASGSYTAAGSFNIANGGSINVAGGTLNLSSATINMGQAGLTTGDAATLNYSSGTLTPGTSTLNYPSNGYINGTPTTLNNLTINSGTIVVNAIPTINGTFQINGGALSQFGVNYATNSLLKYNTAGNPTIRGLEWSSASGAGYPYNVQVSNNTTIDAGGTTYTAKPFNTAGSVTIDAGSAIYMDYSSHNLTVPLTINGNFTLNGSLSESGTAGGDLNIAGNWTNNGTFNNSGRTVTFNGASAQTIGGSTSSSFAYLTINNTSGGVTVAKAATVSSGLTMTNGILNTTTTNTLSVTNTASTAVSGGSATSFVSGPLNWSFPTLSSSNAVYTFPVGGTGYLPFSITNITCATSPVLQVQAFNANSGGTYDATLSGISTTEYWSVTQVSGLFTLGSVSLTRQTPLSGLNAIGYATTAAGTYTSRMGTATSSYTVSNSAVTPTVPVGYFVLGTTVVATSTITSATSSNSAANTGYTGSTITITGTNFLGATAVSFGGTAAASFTVNSNTTITAIVAGGASGNISVSTPLNTALYSGFTYLGYITTVNTDWNTGSTWLGGAVPPTGAITTINNNPVTISGSSQPNPSAITINSGDVLNVSNAAGSLTATTITNNGTLEFTAAGALTATTLTNNGTLLWSAAGTLNIAAGGTLSNAGTVTAGSGTVNYPGAGTINGANAITFNNLTIAGTVTLTTIPTINGNLQINGGNVTAAPYYGSSSSLIYNVSTYTAYLEWTGNATSGAGIPNNVIIGNGTNSAVNFGSSANYYLLNGNLTIASGSSLTQSSNSASAGLKFGGNFTNNGTYTDNSRGTWFIGAAAAGTITSATALTINYLILNSAYNLQLGSSNITLGGNTNALQFLSSGGLDLEAKTLTISSAGTILLNASGIKIIQSTGGTGTFAIAGASGITQTSGSLSTSTSVLVTLAGGLTIGGATAITVNGTLKILAGGYIISNAPIYGNNSLLQYYTATTPYVRGLEWSAASGGGYPYNVEVSDNTTIDAGGTSYTGVPMDLAGNLTIDAGSSVYLDYGGHNMTVSLIINGNLYLNGNIAESGAIGGDIIINGNWVNNGTGTNYFPNSRSVTFSGSSAQALGGTNTTLAAYGFNYLIIDNTGGVTLGQPVTVSNTLTLTSGIVTSTSSNTLTILTGGTISGGSTSSYVSGPLIWDLAGSLSSAGPYAFPVGGTGYLPFSLSNVTTGATGPAIKVQAYNTGSGGTADGSTISSLSNTEYWNASILSGTYTTGSVSIARQTSLGALDAIGRSSSQAGVYSSLGGTVSGDAINNSNPTGASLGYFAMAVLTALPQGSLSANGPFCATGIGQLTWTATSGTANRTSTGVVSGTPFNVYTNPVTSTTSYTIVSVTDANSAVRTGGFTSSTATITVNPLPTAGITGTPTGCSSVSLTATGGSSYSWSGGSSPSTAANTFTSSGTYYVTVTSSSGCTATASQIVSVSQPSTAPTSASASPMSVCTGSSATLTYSGGALAPGATAKWYSGSCGGTLVGTGNNLLVTPSATTTYYIRFEDGAPCSSSTSCQSVTVTVNPTVAPTVSITENPNDPTITYGVSVTFTATPTNGGTSPAYAFYVGSTLEQSGSSNTYTTTMLPVGTDSVKCIITSNAPCVSTTTATSNTITIVVAAGINTWTGTVSNAWTTAGNWTVGVPSCSLDAYIPSNLTTSPLISTSVNVRNLTIEVANVTMTSGAVLGVCGNISTVSGQTLAGTVVLQGTGSQTLGGNYVFNNLTVNGNYTVGATSSDHISVTGILNKTGGTLNTNNKLTLVASSSQTALIADNGGSLSGTASMQQYVGGNVGFHHISSPMSSSDVGNLSGFGIAGPDGVRSSYYQQEGTLQEYTESVNTFPVTDSGYYNYTSLSDALVPGIGYTALFNPTPSILATYGTPNNGNVNVPVTNTAGHQAGVEGWNFVGNPYPSPISWSAVKTLNSSIGSLAGSCYFWKCSTPTTGTWVGYNGTAGTGGVGNVIASSQGFWIDVTSPGSYTLKFSNTVRTQDLSPMFYKAPLLQPNELRLVVSSAADAGSEALMYTDQTGEGSGMIPPLQTYITSPSISYIDGNNAHDMIYVSPSIDENTVTPLAVHIGSAGTYTISASSINVQGMPVYILDNSTNTYYDLGSQSVTITSQGNEDINGRYSVVYSKKKQAAESSMKIYGKTASIAIERSSSDAAQVIVTDMLGREVANVTSTSSTVEIPVADEYAIYIVSVRAKEGNTVKKVVVNNK